MALMRAFLLLSLIFVMAACTSSSSTTPGMDGTSDSGGGNGIENRVYEAYIVHPDQLNAYQQILLPQIKKLAALSQDPEQFLLYFNRWLLYKTWYIAPIKLNSISKDVIGVSFSDDQTEQLALQTKKSIWINSDRFERMSIQDQAALIAHEMTMSLYFLKFKSWSEICTEKIYPNIVCDTQYNDLLNELFPSTTPQPFNTDDYESIRAVTAILLKDSSFKSSAEADSFLISNKFDRRFTFGLGLDGAQVEKQVTFNNSEKISAEDLQKILGTASSLNKMPDQCTGIRFDSNFNCLFSFQKTTRSNKSGIQIPIMLLQVHSLRNEVPIHFSALKGMFGFQSIEGSSIEYLQFKKKISYFIFNPDPTPTPLIVGTPFRSMALVTIQDMEQVQAPHTLLGIIATPGVVTSLNKDATDCIYAKPNASSILDDSLLVYSKYLSDFDKKLLKARAISFPPATTCREF